MHNTALGLQQHLELADHTQYFSQQVFFSLRQFSCLFSAFLGQDHLKVFAGVAGNSLSQVLRKMWKRPTQQGLEHIIPHSLHVSIPLTSCYLRAYSGPDHSNCAEECTSDEPGRSAACLSPWISDVLGLNVLINVNTDPG